MNTDALREKLRLAPSTIEHVATISRLANGSPRTVTGPRWVLLMFSVLSSTFLFALDNTVVAAAQPHIVLHFQAVDRMAWLSVAFAAAALSTNLIFGQLYACMPPKWLYILSVVVFEAGSALCGAAWDMTSLIVGRAVCGVGGIGMYVGVMALLAAMTTVEERPAYIGSIGMTWGLGTILGPVMGGAFTDSSTWRWAFYINLPFAAVILPAAVFILPAADPKAGCSPRARLAETDMIGGFLVLGATSTLVMAINFGGLLFDWNSAAEIALFSVSGALYLCLGCQQAFSLGTAPQHRILCWDVLTAKESRRTVGLMILVTGAGGCGIFVPVYFIPLFFQFTRGDSAMDASLRLLPFIGVMIATVVFQGVLLSRSRTILGLYMPWYTVGGCLTTVGGALMYLVDGGTPDASIYGFSVVLGAGVGMIGQAGFGVAQACVDKTQTAKAVALVALGQTGGITMALAVANTVFVHEAARRLRGIHAAVGGVATEVFGRLPVLESMTLPYIVIMAAGGATAVLSVAMRRERIATSILAISP
ncbi:major facilitator superfamily domain-containing protein [Plectosphaerella cucumerina]|uniref:Major facilitator superfamily domain-containing protein n=1 Tax=Plectosphaerella cucumerina TaxID=40658 RepID=A0A8K0TRE5_9PEZI|nr:major facilitator superfamily domain-containing protein [Plectosphaerella cucumerina]